MPSNKYSINKIAWFPAKLEAMRRGVISPPICVRVKPTNHCCHGCFFCVYRHSFSGMHPSSSDREQRYDGHVSELSAKTLIDLVENLHVIGVKAITLSGGGEPLMHPEIVPVMERILDCQLDLSIITNGQLLTGDRAEVLAGARWVRVSVDYHTPEQMQASRGVNPGAFLALADNLRQFARWKNPGCDLFLNYVVHTGNYRTLRQAAEFYPGLGVENIRFSPMWTRDFESYHRPLQNEVLTQLAAINIKGLTVNTTYDVGSPENQCHRNFARCYFQEMVPVVAADGGVYACHNKAYDPAGLIGSINGNSFADVWFSKEAESRIRAFNPRTACPHQCAADSKNRLIQNLMDAHGDNFV